MFFVLTITSKFTGFNYPTVQQLKAAWSSTSKKNLITMLNSKNQRAVQRHARISHS